MKFKELNQTGKNKNQPTKKYKRKQIFWDCGPGISLFYLYSYPFKKTKRSFYESLTFRQNHVLAK